MSKISYTFDWTQISDKSLRFENLVACDLLKWCHHIEDAGGWEMDLRYFRDTDNVERKGIVELKT